MRRTTSFFVIIAGIAFLLFTTGCGGKSTPKPAPAPETQVQPVQTPQPAPEKKVKKKKKKKVQKEEEPKEELPEELRVEEVTLPAESSQWSEREIVYIRTAQPSLYDLTITELSKRLVHPEKADQAASILSQFVQSVIPGALAQEQKLLANEAQFKEQEGEEKEGKRRTANNSQPIELKFYTLSQNQIRNIMSALASSTCETARKQISAFLAGVLLTDDNKTALDAIMTAYSLKTRNEKMTSEEEDLLLSFLLMPEKGVKMAAEYAEIEAPVIEEAELDANGNPVPKQNNSQNTNHQPIQISPEKRVIFRFQGNMGNLVPVSLLDIQKSVLAKYCPASTPLFRAKIARELTSSEVVTAADTQAKQDFLLNEVMEKFLMKKEFANVIAHTLIYKQPDLDEKWKAVTEENLFKSYTLLMENWFGFIDEKTIEEYRNALTAKQLRLDREKEAETKAIQSAKTTSTAKMPVSLLSRRAESLQKAEQNNQNQNNIQLVQYSPMVELLMNPKEREALEKEIWTANMRSLLLESVEQSLGTQVDEAVANMPTPGSNERPKYTQLDRNAIQAIQMYLTIPCVETRFQIYSMLDKAWLLGPEMFKQSIFEKMELEPGILMVVKSMDRRIAPKVKETKRKNPPKNNSRRKTNRPGKEKAPSMGVLLREKRMETGVAWMDQTYKMVCQWCVKFAQAAQLQKELQKVSQSENSTHPEVKEPKLPEELRQQIPLLKDGVLVAYYTNSDPEMPPMTTAGALKIKFMEFECSGTSNKIVTSFKSKIPKLLERGILTTNNSSQNVLPNALWLERFEINEETTRRESVDVLIVPKHAQQDSNNNQNPENAQPVRRGVEDLTVYILMMEMDDLCGEHQSKLKDDENADESEESEEESDSEDAVEDEEE